MRTRSNRSSTFPPLYATADSPVPLDAAWIETQWRRAIAEGTTRHAPVLLILDELQTVRGWSETLKLLWDSRAGGPEVRVLILGSSALLMQEGLSESLAGRFFLHRCTHWGYMECRAAFGWSLEQWFFFGGYPGAAAFIDDENTWKRYIADALIETVLARDVLQMSRVAKRRPCCAIFLPWPPPCRRRAFPTPGCSDSSMTPATPPPWLTT